MNQIVTQPEQRQLTPQQIFKQDLAKMEGQFAAALPAHMPVERFARVVLTAVQNNPDLLRADQQSLWNACMRAAQDGLLPDAREGAIVVYNTKDGRKAQWMPMVSGILKKVRNSGELLTISAYVAYEKDHFEYSLGDEESITHRPCLDDDRGDPKLVYAVAKTKDGGIYREIMLKKDVEKVRNASKAKDSGPWRDWWDEMAKKTVIRRLAKRLPMSTDMDDLIRRDDELYDFQNQRQQQLAQPSGLAARLASARQNNPAPPEGFNAVSGEIIDAETGEISSTQDDAQAGQGPPHQVSATAPEEPKPENTVLTDLKAVLHKAFADGDIRCEADVDKIINFFADRVNALTDKAVVAEARKVVADMKAKINEADKY